VGCIVAILLHIQIDHEGSRLRRIYTMKKYGWTEAALLLAPPLWAALEFSRGHPLSGIVLIAAAFAIIFIHYFSARRETRRKHEKLQEAGRTDGRYLAEHLNDFGDLQSDSAVVLPANFLPRFEAELAKASETNPASSRSEARSSILRPWLSSQTHSHSSGAELQSEEFPVDGDAHCGEPMKLVRVIPKTRMLAELYMFKCLRCGHVKTREEQPTKWRSLA
jgi:hypothetical protein